MDDVDCSSNVKHLYNTESDEHRLFDHARRPKLPLPIKCIVRRLLFGAQHFITYEEPSFEFHIDLRN